ncbi:MAG TPA: methyltransferase domain-containing protein [Chloroflexota bacterium]|nr:methyltransferase domain-containing protein [Chloroflexota bacterium]
MPNSLRPIPAEAAAYERFGAPRGAPYTRPLLALAPPWPGARVLDVACGTGVVARAVAPALGPRGLLVAVDRSPAMVAATRIRAEEAAGASPPDEPIAPPTRVAVMDAHALALADAAFDLAYCQFGLMLMTEPVRAAAELARIVRPGGAVAAVVWSEPARVVGFAAYFAAIHTVVPGAGAVEQHPVFSLAAPAALADVLSAAGLRVEREEHVAVEDPLTDLDEYWAWVSTVLGFPVQAPDGWALRRIVDFPPVVQAAARAEALARVQPYVQPDGRLALPSEAVLAVARR